MKLEWGKKIYCPACGLPFYDMQKTSLSCPNCGHKFSSVDLTVKKNSAIAMDEVPDIDDKNPLSNFEFEEEEEVDVGFVDDADDLSTKEEIMDEIKLVDEE
ncbi:MAG: FYDLN acid domain-containing protein [Holosporales bacterium]|jgi:hypothetical protein|nr:FYDLN acid domain-containing protein [Holosporales bacterium]